MPNREKCLFVFEGKNPEKQIVWQLEKNFLGEKFAIKCIFDAEIYQLYQKMKDADGFPVDLVNLLKERADNAKELKDFDRDSFASIYLFFDYDAHSTLADDGKIKEMLAYFNNETENGMLYISYPMVEAIKHFPDEETFKNLIVKCKGRNCQRIEVCPDKDACLKEPHYKEKVGKECPKINLHKISFELWCTLIKAHLCKMNVILGNDDVLPDSIYTQLEVFEKQMEKYIAQDCPKVAVLSAFPLFVLDYYGCETTKEKLKGN